MFISQKSRYALKALLELANRAGDGPVKIGEIAEARSIPPRFLEVILNQLKQSGFVDARRGSDGGYFLIRPPRKITVGEVLRFVQGLMGPEELMSPGASNDRAFVPMWRKVHEAILDVFDNTTFQDLLEEEMKMQEQFSPDFAI
jgi:Rrf2 family protein